MIVEVSKGQQITLPASLRKKYGWKPGTKINLEDGPDGVKLEAVASTEAWDDVWAETRRHPCTLKPKELDDLIKHEFFGR
jgi:AbrB family looped-hinge helix DNA binding protein